MDDRPSLKTTTFVVENYFKEEEHEKVLKAVRSAGHSGLYFDDAEVGFKFFKDLRSAGWGEFNLSVDQYTSYFNAKTGAYEFLQDQFVDETLTRVKDIDYAGPDEYVCSRTQEPVTRVSDLDPKELKRYVTIQKAA